MFGGQLRLRPQVGKRVGRNSVAYSATFATADYAFGSNPPYALFASGTL